MKQSEFVIQLRQKFSIEYKNGGDNAIAERLGMSPATVKSWAKSSKDLEPFQVANAILKAQQSAVDKSNYETVWPIVEFYPITCTPSKSEKKYEILPLAGTAGRVEEGLREELDDKSGIYIFYDSRGQAIYAGKAKAQSLLKEMNLVFNRDREEVQTIKLVDHPSRQQAFRPAYDQPRQPKERAVRLHELAHYFSAYWVNEAMIDDLEALLVRGFANDLLNIRMEKFEHFKR